MRRLGDPSDLRGLLHLSDAKLEDHDRELAKLVDEFEKGYSKEKLKISVLVHDLFVNRNTDHLQALVNHVVAFKIKEKEEVPYYKL